MLATGYIQADLRNVSLQGAWLTKLSEVRALANAGFQGAEMERADLTGVDLTSCELDGAWLSGARLAGARLKPRDRERARRAYARPPESDLVLDSTQRSATADPPRDDANLDPGAAGS